VTGIIHQCNMLDATILGMGRGAGNCPLELLMSFLKNPKYKLRPILQVIQDYMIDMQKEIDWGYHIPYLISGALNQHPRDALKWMGSEQKLDFVSFFNQINDKFDL
jgi:4-hydroxy 2-oxovalerate aldolase